jgi:hypothetical protein
MQGLSHLTFLLILLACFLLVPSLKVYQGVKKMVFAISLT